MALAAASGSDSAGIRRSLIERPATLADVDAICAMHQRCSAESLYRRYLMAVREASPAAVRQLLSQTSTVIVEEAAGCPVAMGNVALGETEAEFAVLVEDDWQRRGLGRRLAEIAAMQALEAGAKLLTTTVLASNVAIRRTLAAADLAPVIVDVDAGTLELHCDLESWAQRRRFRQPAERLQSEVGATDLRAADPPAAYGQRPIRTAPVAAVQVIQPRSKSLCRPPAVPNSSEVG